MNGYRLMNSQSHPDPTFAEEESTKSGSLVFVALIPMLVNGRSPVMKEPAPANVFEVLTGDRKTASPNWTIAPVSTLIIFTFPTMEGTDLTPFSAQLERFPEEVIFI